MSEENRRIIFWALGYPEDQSAIGMLARDLPKLQALENALDEAERRGAEGMRERAAKEAQFYANTSTMARVIVKRIRALPIEGPKDGK